MMPRLREADFPRTIFAEAGEDLRSLRTLPRQRTILNSSSPYLRGASWHRLPSTPYLQPDPRSQKFIQSP
jgi:hypothetical protein